MKTKTMRSAGARSDDGSGWRWSLRLGKFLGIDVYLHFTFLLLLGFLGVAHWLPGRSVEAALGGVLFFAAIFGCVLVHEFGHALAARRFGVGTSDIILLPIGGVARLERIPSNPAQEFWIAVAGPATNVVIGAVLAIWLVLTRSWTNFPDISTISGSFGERLLAVNIFLALFNLLPAFPMDGGRVLRSLLAMRLEYVKATQIAARLGQGMAGVFAVVGLLYNPMLLLIAFFVWTGAVKEMGFARTRSALTGIPVGEAMVSRFVSLRQTDTLGMAAGQVLAGAQQDFPVMDREGVVGVLERRHLLEGLSRLGPNAFVDEVMVHEFPTLAPDEMVEAALDRHDLQEFPMLPVLDRGRLVGVFTTDNLTDLMLINSALRQRPGGAFQLNSSQGGHVRHEDPDGALPESATESPFGDRVRQHA